MRAMTRPTADGWVVAPGTRHPAPGTRQVRGLVVRERGRYERKRKGLGSGAQGLG